MPRRKVCHKCQISVSLDKFSIKNNLTGNVKLLMKCFCQFCANYRFKCQMDL